MNTTVLTPDARALWLMLLNQGGWWSLPELQAHWEPTFTDSELEQLLSALVASKHVAQRTNDFGSRYGVTTTCTPYPGLSLRSKHAANHR